MRTIRFCMAGFCILVIFLCYEAGAVSDKASSGYAGPAGENGRPQNRKKHGTLGVSDSVSLAAALGAETSRDVFLRLRRLYRRGKERGLTAYLAAGYLTKLGRPYRAGRWYGRAMKSVKYDEENPIVYASLVRLSQGAGYGSFLRRLKRSEDVTAGYFVALYYQKNGFPGKAAARYLDILDRGNIRLRRAALRSLVRDRRVVVRLTMLGIDRTRFLEMLKEAYLWDEAVSYSFRVPGTEALLTRAYCYFHGGNSESALQTYLDYYGKTGNPGVLLNAARCCYEMGKKEDALCYLKRYGAEREGGTETIPYEACLLRLELEKRSRGLEKYIEDVVKCVSIYGKGYEVDALVYRTFYYAVERGHVDSGLNFLKRTVLSLSSGSYRAWAFYILGLYSDSSYMQRVVAEQSASNSYYFFKAVRYLEQNGGVTDRDAENERREIHTGIPEADTGDGTDWMFRSDRIRAGPLYVLYAAGLGREVEELSGFLFPLCGAELRSRLNHILSLIHHESGDFHGGVRYAENLVKAVKKEYRAHLPPEILRLLYPDAFTYEIETHLEGQTDLDVSFVQAVIREESRYNEKAVSSVGAVGLMQLMPATASWMLARNVSGETLFNGTMNIDAGIRYLHYLFRRFEEPEIVLAAYNGGPGNVNRWRAKRVSTDCFIEEIPFTETRDFVKKVYVSAMMYRNLYPPDS